MSLHRAATPVLLLLALAACGDRERGFEPVAVEEEAEPLPAPLPVTGPVTGVPPAAGADAAGVLAGADPADAGALPVITPVGPAGADAGALVSPGTEAATDGVASIGFAGATLPPLEDNPEAGLAPLPVAASAPVATPASVSTTAPAATGGQRAAAAVEAYYAAVRAGDLARAYAAWSDGGRASGRTPEQFAEGFDGVSVTAVTLGEPGRVEGAAGSRYVEVPVTVTSRDRDGRETRQVGAFVMRSSDVEGAPAGWYIASAELRELQP